MFRLKQVSLYWVMWTVKYAELRVLSNLWLYLIALYLYHVSVFTIFTLTTQEYQPCGSWYFGQHGEQLRQWTSNLFCLRPTIANPIGPVNQETPVPSKF